ncbi:MAG TPA: metallopeptidase family protein [Methylocystis sp.]|nr:metallopeptidase family protein [Methylocystis sp.]
MSQTDSDLQDLGARKAPGLDEIEALARRVYASLPSRFTRLCEGLVIRVEDFPEDEILEEMECETEFDLLGFFRGQGLTQGEHLAQTGAEPNMIWLYRRPLLDYWADGEDTLGEVVAHVLIHEIGHHFGLSDDDMEQIEEAAV